MLVFALAPT